MGDNYSDYFGGNVRPSDPAADDSVNRNELEEVARLVKQAEQEGEARQSPQVAETAMPRAASPAEPEAEPEAEGDEGSDWDLLASELGLSVRSPAIPAALGRLLRAGRRPLPRLRPRPLALPRLALPRLALPRLALPRLALQSGIPPHRRGCSPTDFARCGVARRASAQIGRGERRVWARAFRRTVDRRGGSTPARRAFRVIRSQPDAARGGAGCRAGRGRRRRRIP